MRIFVTVLGRFALFLLLVTTAACANDTGDVATPATPVDNTDVTIPESSCAEAPALACDYDAACEGLGVETGTCEVTRCVQGCCEAIQAPTFSACEAAGAGPCEEGTCSTSGACIVVTAGDGQSCDDDASNACAVYTCQGGNCVDTPLTDCDDDDICTTDACAMVCEGEVCEAECSHVAADDGFLCNDYNACTGGDTCTAGVCAGSEDLCECAADADCLVKDADFCDDTSLVCDAENSKCVAVTVDAVDCSGIEVTACETAACEPTTGQCATSVMAEGSTCDDGDACTGCAPGQEECEGAHDACDAAGACAPGDGTPCACTEDVDCAAFDDGDLCNGTSICSEGTCAATDTVVDCSEQNAPTCHTLACAPETGACDAFPADTEVACETDNPCALAAACDADQVCQDTDLVEDGTSCGEAGETCLAGVCTAPDPCEGVVCDGAPAASCGGDVLTTYDAAGTCGAEGACEYASSDTDCTATAQVCAEGACVDPPDPCEGVVCDGAPAASCEGDVLTTYDAAGTCGAEGACEYASSDTDCTASAQVCDEGACVDPGPCEGVVCQNGGACEDGVDSYTCACAAGWEGMHCELDVDECADAVNPQCLNATMCENYEPGSQGICQGGPWGGACDSEVCTAAVSAISDWCGPTDEGGFNWDTLCAQCAAGTVTELMDCSSITDECTDPKGYYCHCEAGWTGPNCGVSTN